MPSLKPEVLKNHRALLNIFVDNEDTGYGKLFTDTQVVIFDLIAKRRYPRTQLILPTQYGKSLAVALGALMRVANKKEKWAIIAPTEDKARIIMDYIIEHTFDDPVFLERLEFYGSKEKLLQERNKTRLTFRDRGEVRVYTANATNSQNVKKALMGFGAPNIILDESSLVPDDLYSTVKRMLGGTQDNFLLEIGNPTFRNHFYRTWVGNRYIKIFRDVYMALAEGRYTQDYIDEMKEEANFEWMYECKFPEESEILPNGYRRLITDSFIENALITEELPIVEGDQPVLGVDPSHGGSNFTVFSIRYPQSGFAKVLKKEQYSDTEDATGEIIADTIKFIKQFGIGDYRVGVDAGGVGAGVADGLLAKGYLIQPVLFGESAENKARYANKKAELFWEMRKWVRAENGQFVTTDAEKDGILELKVINYKENSTSKIQMEPKEDLGKRGIASPDTADSLALTFVDTTGIVEEDDIGLLDEDDISDDEDLEI